MSDIDKEFWEAVKAKANGPVPYEDLKGTIEQVLKDPAYADWAKLPDSVDTTVLYSGTIQGKGVAENLRGGATPVAEDLGMRGQGTIGIINDTKTGKALGGMTEALADGTLEAKYGDYVDFSKAPIDSAKYNEILNTDTSKMTDLEFGKFTEKKVEAYKLSTPIYDGFQPSSEAFAAQIKGRVITVTPHARKDRDFRQHEVPNLVKGLEDGRITHVNGVPRDQILKELGELKGEARYVKAFNSFNESFAKNMKRLGNDVYIDPDGKTTGMDINQEHLTEHGASENARLNDFDPKAGIAQDIHGFKAEMPRIVEADKAGELHSFVADADGRTSHMIDMQEGKIYTIVEDHLVNVKNFPDSKTAGHEFGRMMQESAADLKGMPKLHNSLGSLGQHVNDLGRPAWRQKLGAIGEGIGKVGGKATKILGPLGVAAAGAEVYGLETKLQSYEKFGLVPKDAMLAYRGILTGHTAQATLDPTLLGGEIPVQIAHDEWAKAYNIDGNVKKALEPGSLLKDINSAKSWLDMKATQAGMAVKDYAVSRWNDPLKIGEDLERIGEVPSNIRDAGLKKGADVLEKIRGQSANSSASSVNSEVSKTWMIPPIEQGKNAVVKDTNSAVANAPFHKEYIAEITPLANKAFSDPQAAVERIQKMMLEPDMSPKAVKEQLTKDLSNSANLSSKKSLFNGRRAKAVEKHLRAHQPMIKLTENWAKETKYFRGSNARQLTKAWENQDIGIPQLSPEDLKLAKNIANESSSESLANIPEAQAKRLMDFNTKYEQRFGTANMFLKQSDMTTNNQLLSVREGVVKNMKPLKQARSAANKIEKGLRLKPLQLGGLKF